MSRQTIGPWSQGDVPDATSYTFLDSAGVALTLTGAWTGTFTINRSDASSVIRDAILNTGTATASYVWRDGDLTTAGRYQAFFRVTDGDQVFTSDLLDFAVYRATTVETGEDLDGGTA